MEPLNLFVVSDATGTTAESVLTSVLVQFRGDRFIIKRFPFTRTVQRLEEIMDEAPAGNCIVVFTLLSKELRNLVVLRGKEKKVTVVDVIGPLISTFTGLLKQTPQMNPGTLRHEDENVYRLTEAIRFTLSHDDGQGLETVEEADLIIVGVSRTGKTPTSIYLSCRRLKVANVPIVSGIPVSEQIYKSNVKKVGFRMSIDRLVELRSERARQLSRHRVRGYSTHERVMEEIEYCEEIYKRMPLLWTIDVTSRSIEETAEWITRNVL